MSEVLKSKSLILVDHKEGKIRLEYNNWLAILHIAEAKDFNRTSYRWFFEQMEEVWQFLHTAGYRKVHAAVPIDNTVTNKFIGRLGFTFVNEANGMNVYEYIGED